MHDVSAKLVSGCLFLFIAASQAAATEGPVGCGTVIDAGETVVLTNNVGPCDDPVSNAITLEEGATLDMNGFTVTCANNNANMIIADGIFLAGSGATLSNGKVVGCDAGVWMSGTGRHRVSDVEADGNNIGFLVQGGSDKNRLDGNRALNSTFSGFHVDGDKNKMTLNSSEANGQAGFRMTGDKNKLLENEASGNEWGFQPFGARNKLIENDALENDFGIDLAGDRNKAVRNESANNTGRGINVTESGAKVIKNEVTNNGGDGIRVAATTTKVKVVGNIATGNGTGDGLDLRDMDPACAGHIWKKNVFTTADPDCVQ
ncbi:MAG TPA: right-handed parallel beta-helix repeat-containing protein [Candidatus Binatia bacterium]|nr:right-handed parallel beta-helix repeat-containing protein [Candidatus Binatia bacterium]